MILEVKNLSVSYGDQKILDDISFSLDKGDALAIIGPNGSGKTTLLRALLGAIPFKGRIVKDANSRIGYVPQKIDLERDLPLTVEEFFSLKSGLVSAGGLYKPQEVLELVKLNPDFLNKRFSDLSAGEFQRVLIGWAIMGHPEILLFDEPTASVDVAGQERIYELLHRLQDINRLTLVLISHDLSVVYRYTNKVLCLNHRQICFGSPHEVLTPEELEKLYGGGGKFYHHQIGRETSI